MARTRDISVKSFEVIVFTRPDITDGPAEANHLTSLLDSGAVDRIHIRKPGASKTEVATLISGIRPDLHCRLHLHDCFGLTESFRLGGVHLNSRNPAAPRNTACVSRSCHTIEEISAARCSYVTLSPVFDSISKTGYTGRFGSMRLPAGAESVPGRPRVIALGGVTPDKFPILADAGYDGAALLGYVWRQIDAGREEDLITDILLGRGQACRRSPIATSNDTDQ